MHLTRIHPVVGRASVPLAQRADVGAVFHARHIAHIRTGQEAVGPLLRIERCEGAAVHQRPAHVLILCFGTIAPVHAVRLHMVRHRLHPCPDARVRDVGRRVQRHRRAGIGGGLRDIDPHQRGGRVHFRLLMHMRCSPSASVDSPVRRTPDCRARQQETNTKKSLLHCFDCAGQLSHPALMLPHGFRTPHVESRFAVQICANCHKALL